MRLKKNSVVEKIKKFNNLNEVIVIKEENKTQTNCNKEDFENIFENICEKISKNEINHCTFAKLDTKNIKKIIEDITDIEEKCMKKIENNSEHSKEIQNLYKNSETEKYKEQNVIFKDFFSIDKDKLSKARNFEKSFEEIISVLEIQKNIEKLDFKINIIKENEELRLEAFQYKNFEKIKEYKSNDFNEFKEQIIENLNLKINTQEKGYKELNKVINFSNDIEIKMEKNFKFSYEVSSNSKEKTFLDIDLGKAKNYSNNKDKILNNIGLLLTTENYSEIYEITNKDREYTKINELEKINNTLAQVINHKEETETWEEKMNDIKAYALDETVKKVAYNDLDYFLDKICDNSFNKFEEKFLKTDMTVLVKTMIDKKENEFLKDNLAIENSDLTKSGFLIKFNQNDNIKDLYYKNDKFDEKEYNDTIKYYLINKFDETLRDSIITKINQIESKTDFIDLKNEILNEETGTIRKENEYIKNAFLISLKNVLEISDEKDIFKIETNPKESEMLWKSFEKEMKKINIGFYKKSDFLFKDLQTELQIGKYDFLVEEKINEHFSDKLSDKKENIELNMELNKTKEFDLW